MQYGLTVNETVSAFLFFSFKNHAEIAGARLMKDFEFTIDLKGFFVISAQFQRIRFGRFCGWLSPLEAGIVSYLKQRKF